MLKHGVEVDILFDLGPFWGVSVDNSTCLHFPNVQTAQEFLSYVATSKSPILFNSEDAMLVWSFLQTHSADSTKADVGSLGDLGVPLQQEAVRPAIPAYGPLEAWGRKCPVVGLRRLAMHEP